MISTVGPAASQSPNLLSLPSELRLLIYSYLGPFLPLEVEIHEGSNWKSKVDDNIKAVASLSLTSTILHQDVAGLLNEIREATISIGHRPPHLTSNHEFRFVESKPDKNLYWLLRMASVKVFLWIDLSQCPGGDEDIEVRNHNQINKTSTFLDIVTLLESSAELESFCFYAHVTGMWSSANVSIVGKQLLHLQDEIDAEARSMGWSRKDRELEHARRAIPLLKLGVEDPELVDPAPGWPSHIVLGSEAEVTRLWRGAFH